jgi:hypothetical protein
MTSPTKNKKLLPTDPKSLSAPDFRYFLKYFPEGVLQAQGVKRHALWGVGMALAQYGDYERGTGIRVSQLTLSQDAGLSHNTVRKVMDLLKTVGAVEVTDKQRRGGTPSENYRLRRSPFVRETLELKDRDWGKVAKRRVVQVDHSHVQVDHSRVQVDDNKNSQNEKNRSLANAPSPSPVALPLRGSDEESNEVEELQVELDADEHELVEPLHGTSTRTLGTSSRLSSLDALTNGVAAVGGDAMPDLFDIPLNEEEDLVDRFYQLAAIGEYQDETRVIASESVSTMYK